MPFTVTNTKRVTSVSTPSLSMNPRVLADRTDLNMVMQRRTSRSAMKHSLQAALIQDYEATIASRETHKHFLRMMLTEVQRYQRNHRRSEIPARTLKVIAHYNHCEMEKNDCDHYAACLAEMSCLKMYSATFVVQANTMASNNADKDFGASSTSEPDDLFNTSVGGLSDG